MNPVSAVYRSEGTFNADAIRKLTRENEALRDALISMLNVEGPALKGGMLPVYNGLDVAWHFEKARTALKQED